MSDTLINQAITTISNANFREQWPMDARKVLVKAARTEPGADDQDVPLYARRQVGWALSQARKVERRLLGDIIKAEASLPESIRQRELERI